MEHSAMAKEQDPERDRKPHPEEEEPRAPRVADGSDVREESSLPEQDHKAQDGDSADPEEER